MTVVVVGRGIDELVLGWFVDVMMVISDCVVGGAVDITVLVVGRCVDDLVVLGWFVDVMMVVFDCVVVVGKCVVSCLIVDDGLLVVDVAKNVSKPRNFKATITLEVIIR